MIPQGTPSQGTPAAPWRTRQTAALFQKLPRCVLPFSEPAQAGLQKEARAQPLLKGGTLPGQLEAKRPSL